MITPLKVLSLLFLFLLISACTTSDHRSSKVKDNNVNEDIRIGAIVDLSSRIGKEEAIGMEIAKEDFYGSTNQTLHLHINDTRKEPFLAALAAKDLVDSQHVQAILGPQTWEEVSLAAEISSKNQIPIVSLADTIPKWATERWPFLHQASPNKYAQMEAIAAIVRSWSWYQVTVIYEDTADSSASGIIAHLHEALRKVNSEVSEFVALPPIASPDSVSKQLENLQSKQSRVFVVHLSLPLALRLFESANKKKMMAEGYVWITTDPITSLFHSINASVLSSMQGIVGVKSYPETKQGNFKTKFRVRFDKLHPEEEKNEPGIYAVEAYAALFSTALALRKGNMKGGARDLSGEVQSTDQTVFQIVNVNGTSYMELGFWSNELGFSKTIDKNAIYNRSMIDLGGVLWPGGPSYTPRGWSIPTTSNPLRIGVPSGSGYKEYCKVEPGRSGTQFSGFTIEVFKATVKNLSFDLPYEFVGDNRTYDDLVQQIHLKNFDAVVGDVEIVSSRYQYAEFSNPYTETGLLLIVPVRSSSESWSFIKPFTTSMWILTAVITIYNGFALWLIERRYRPQLLQGSILNQIGIVLWLAFNTLFSKQGERLHNNLSRLSVVVWLFVAVVITQTYSANLTSMLTIQRSEPTIPSVEDLINYNEMVGYCSSSFVRSFLEEVLHFQSRNLLDYSTAESYAQAFDEKKIAAGFIGAPYAKIFLAKYGNKYMQVGQTYKIGGFGFAFPRGSPLLPSINEALLNIYESGKLKELEKLWITPPQGHDKQAGENSSLGPHGFRVLFLITGATSTIALVGFIFKAVNASLGDRTIRSIMSAAISKLWCSLKKKVFAKRTMSNDQSPGNSSPGAPNPQSQM